MKNPATAYNIEIISLIYCNTDYLEMIVEELKKVQRENSQINVGIRVVANDANKKVIRKLRKLDVPYAIYNDKNPDEYYINRVYRCYNYAVKTSKYDNVCLVNSDMCFSKNWLKNLLKYHNGVNIPSSRLIESGKMPSGKYGVSLNCGTHPTCMDFEKWQKVSEKMAFNDKDVVKEGGLYMPCIFETKRFIEAGGYPEGNVYSGGIGSLRGEFIKSGDDYFFHDILEKKFNMKHITVFDSLCYHIQEGERDEDFKVKLQKIKIKIKKRVKKLIKFF